MALLNVAKQKVGFANMDTLDSRFWAKVNKIGANDCWNWTAHVSKSGYGWMGVGNKKSNFAHRVCAVLEGLLDSLDNPLHVLHKCDNRKCCNPSHLFTGTNADNIADRVSKNRSKSKPQPGELNGMAKLSTVDIIDIRRIYAQGGISQSKLAKMYNTQQSNISRVVNNKRWASL
jgi:hypothetical protein